MQDLSSQPGSIHTPWSGSLNHRTTRQDNLNSHMRGNTLGSLRNGVAEGSHNEEEGQLKGPGPWRQQEEKDPGINLKAGLASDLDEGRRVNCAWTSKSPQ